MRTAFIILAHERLDQVADLARALTGAGGAVVIHVDARIGDLGPLDGLGERVRVISRHASEWGMFGLVAATLDAAREMTAAGWAPRHVCLLSGSCLPIRPLAELEAFLAQHPKTDFIESVPVAEADWVQGGLSDERFTLWFPLPWRKRRRLFDLLTEVQRRLRVRRALPSGLAPHLGLQWWCLTWKTLGQVLEHPDLEAWTRHFRWAWIPDEGFFQSAVRALPGRQIDLRPLTLQRFDTGGRPFVFHDDHQTLLDGSDFFFARKIDPDADALRGDLLARAGAPEVTTRFWANTDEAAFEAARGDVTGEHFGVHTQGRWPAGASAQMVDTATPYLVFVSDDEGLLDRLRGHLATAAPKLRLHGHLFGPHAAEFRQPGPHWWGNLPGAPMLRDYRPEQFLARMIWAEREVGTAFLFDPTDNSRIARLIARDRNARLVLLPSAMRAEALMGMLRRFSGPAVNGKARRRRGSFYALHRVLDGREVAGDLDSGAGAGLDGIVAIARSDWRAAADWQVGEEDPE